MLLETWLRGCKCLNGSQVSELQKTLLQILHMSVLQKTWLQRVMNVQLLETILCGSKGLNGLQVSVLQKTSLQSLHVSMLQKMWLQRGM